MEQSVKQFPVDLDKAGLYAWTLEHASGKVEGHIVVRGTDADPINGWTEYEQGKEYWYTGEDQGGGASPGKFTVTLLMLVDPDDAGLKAAITDVRADETQMGSDAMVPSWTSGAPLPPDPVIYTETDVENGPGDYDSLYTNVSLAMPVDDGTPLMPTLYTSIEDLFSIFGGSLTNPPIEEGIVASFTEVESGDDGWPSASSWYWTGRDPS